MVNEIKMINGSGPDSDSFNNMAMQVCIERLKENPELVILYDIETGCPYLATKECQQNLIDLWESLKPKNIEPLPGKIWIYGTGENEFEKINWEELWKRYLKP